MRISGTRSNQKLVSDVLGACGVFGRSEVSRFEPNRTGSTSGFRWRGFPGILDYFPSTRRTVLSSGAFSAWGKAINPAPPQITKQQPLFDT